MDGNDGFAGDAQSLRAAQEQAKASASDRSLALEELRAALNATPRRIPSKYFYDDRGSALFERIMSLPEYYPTRTERELLRAEAHAILAAAGGEVAQVVELGSGAASKTVPLLHAVLGAGRPPRYLAIDISEHALQRTRQILAHEPGVEVELLCADYSRGLQLPRRAVPGSRLAIFLGGTIGNEDDASAIALFSGIRAQLDPGDALLVGASLVTSPEVIEAAYNDAAGVTAAFNKNILLNVNALCGARFDPADFDHVAPYDRAKRRVEMWLRARRDLKVDLGALGQTLTLSRGEGIRTEISRRFTRDELQHLLSASGFSERGWFPSPDGRFGLALGICGSVH